MDAEFADRRARFAALHEAGCFVIPNPWDVGSARALAALGFEALATTSAGMALSAGRPDGATTRDEALRHVATLARATSLPLNADFEDGFGASAEEVGESVRACVVAGASGLSIEDWSSDPAIGFHARDVAVRRLRAARAAIDFCGERVLLVARSEAFLNGHPGGLGEALARVERFASEGADVLYVPGLSTDEDVRAVVRVAGRTPVNVLVNRPNFTVARLADLGVR
ncbi:MAG: isocitrate lyase/PEP mutase family protein, partial [Hyphomicrobiales bacterium]|nr:isocitrate lyase/PEP mutase family protein [Hyphomicrobiales bacterium]